MMTLFLSLALAASAAENPPVGAQAGTAQPAKPAKPKKICKSTNMTGSNLGRRVCKTQEQWDAANEANIDSFDHSYKAQQGNDNPLGGN